MAEAGEDAGIEGLDAPGINGAVLGRAGNQPLNGVGNQGLGAGPRNREALAPGFAFHFHCHRATTRNASDCDQQHVEQHLCLVLGKEHGCDLPFEVRLFTGHEQGRHAIGLAGVDIGARSRGRTEGKAGEFELGARLARGIFDQLLGEALHFDLGGIGEHFEPIADRSDRVDEVMANARA